MKKKRITVDCWDKGGHTQWWVKVSRGPGDGLQSGGLTLERALAQLAKTAPDEAVFTAAQILEGILGE